MVVVAAAAAAAVAFAAVARRVGPRRDSVTYKSDFGSCS